MYRMSEEQQEKVLNNFKKVMDKQNAGLINKELYYHLNINCNFVAHFNLQGFREAYAGDQFDEFAQFFDPHSPASQWLNAPEISTEFAPLNQSLMEYASTHAHANPS